MTTNLDLMRRAFLSAEGRRGVPTGDDASLALIRWQDVVSSLVLERDEGWTDVFAPASGAVAAKDGQRIHAGTGVTVTLPTRGEDGVGAPLDLSRVHVVGASPQAGLWLYAASLGRWSRVDKMTVSGDSPFGPEDDLGLSALLAVALVGDGGGETASVIDGLASACLTNLAARMRREVNVAAIDGVLNLSEMGNDHGF